MNNKKTATNRKGMIPNRLTIFDKKVFCRYCFNFSGDNIDFWVKWS
ncbi:Uncharacterised protein [Staphylococcus aureus]|uniref:Uncharacterized protein n=1 Tax=Staphylococcus aureus TaxID=1280 RepID=A0A380DIL5_STAAU|nr:Uncharacterised protein [Staphylococcus aureus]